MKASILFETIVLLSVVVAALSGQPKAGPVPLRAQDVCPLKPGMNVPDVAVTDLSGNTVRLMDAVRDHKTMVVFYRGGWCPFCNLQLQSLQGVEADLKNLGYQMLAISADRPTKLRESLAKHRLTYQLLSDSSMAASRAFGIAFQVDSTTVERYRSRSMDLEDASGEHHHLLPVPSVFLIDEKGRIAFTYVNPDYRVRLDPGTMVALATSMAATKE